MREIRDTSGRRFDFLLTAGRPRIQVFGALSHTKSEPSRRTSAGFALIVTILLLSFLVLLLVSITTLTRVETQVATHQQKQDQARQNALLALTIALGQLQKYAGPDARVTARAEITATAPVTNPYFTGVWDAGDSTPSPLVWLVSGSENPATTPDQLLAGAPDPATDTLTDDVVFLVGNQSVAAYPSAPTPAEKKQRIKLAKQTLLAAPGSMPGWGAMAAPVIGRYAWWVGDQGVKASLALPDRADEITYAPWSTPAQRHRIRQQIGSGPNYFRAATATTAFKKEGFDPLAVGAPLGNVQTVSQLAFLAPVSGSMGEFVRGHYHDFTTVARSVLANTRTDAHRGLLHDLSLAPGELGAAFARYADYPSYMETPGGTTPGAACAIPLIDTVDSPRRRYKMMSYISAAGDDDLPEIAFSAAPVLSGFYMQFYLYKSKSIGGGPAKTGTHLTMQSRLYAALWNPYATALAPSAASALSLEVELPTITANDVPVDLNLSPGSAASGGVTLPFSAGARYSASFGSSHDFGAAGEMASWLPGRVYAWASDNDSTAELGFYTNSVNVWTSSGVATVAASSETFPHIVIPAATIIVRLKLNGVTVSTYTARYDADEIPGVAPSIPVPGWSFGYGFRLNQPRTYNKDRTWLAAFDPRDCTIDQSASPVAADSAILVSFNTSASNSSLPSIYNTEDAEITKTLPGDRDDEEFQNAYLSGNLLFRTMGKSAEAMSICNDVSLFELPRLPLLSTGELQHLQVKGRRPFSIGNSWGGAANIIFDRFYFSGLPAAGTEPDVTSGVPLPNWNLHALPGATLAVLRSDDTPTEAALSARYLLQAGGFNINSTSAPAWRAMLSGVRFSAAAPFVAAKIVNGSTNTDACVGTQDGTLVQDQTFSADATLGASPAPVFFRFPQSAQEVFYWAYPSTAAKMQDDHPFNVSAFRLGVRGCNDAGAVGGFAGDAGTFAGAVAATSHRQEITTDQIEGLAAEIVVRLCRRAAVKGPFRNLQEFLAETTEFSGKSLLEDAIDAAGINPAEVQAAGSATNDAPGGIASSAYSGFSTQTLSQADLLTALAPYFRSRSDTFVIRTYGETVNPATSRADGNAWAEAIVQRFPETVDAADSIAQPAGVFGRRFKIISFRWLSSAEI